MSRLLGWGGIQMCLWGNINLFDMYAQYGSIEDVLRLSYKMPSQDVLWLGMWNVGKGKRNWNCFKEFVLLIFSISLSTAFFPQYMCFVCQKNYIEFWLNVILQFWCAGGNYFLDHKSSNSITKWERGRLASIVFVCTHDGSIPIKNLCCTLHFFLKHIK